MYHAFQVACPLPQHANFGLTNEREQKYYSMAHRSRDTVRCVVNLLYAHWSILNLSVEEVDKQTKKHGSYIQCMGETRVLYIPT